LIFDDYGRLKDRPVNQTFAFIKPKKFTDICGPIICMRHNSNVDTTLTTLKLQDMLAETLR